MPWIDFRTPIPTDVFRNNGVVDESWAATSQSPNKTRLASCRIGLGAVATPLVDTAESGSDTTPVESATSPPVDAVAVLAATVPRFGNSLVKSGTGTGTRSSVVPRRHDLMFPFCSPPRMLAEFPSACASYDGVCLELVDTECLRAKTIGRRCCCRDEGCVSGKICFVEAVTVEYGKNCARSSSDADEGVVAKSVAS